MRKKTIANIADHIFWLIIALLPLVLYVLKVFPYRLPDVSAVLPDFREFLVGFGVSDSGIVYSAINDIFGNGGIFPLFADNTVLILYMSYFISVEIVHLFVDFLVFIPRLSHKWMEKITCLD